jgi:hypothetical protein
VVDIATIARRTFGAIADPHADGGLFVGGVTAPIEFLANSARPPFSNAAKAVDGNWLSLREVTDRRVVGIVKMD